MVINLRQILTGFTLLAVTVIVGLGSVEARSFRVSQIPNGSKFRCANCHLRAGSGGPRNAFGQAIENGFLNGSGGGASVNWNATIAAVDSDGDGVSNGAELGDPDGDGTPDVGATVTNPGDAQSFVVQQPLPDDTPASPEVDEGDVLVLVGDVELAAGKPNDPLGPGVHEFTLTFGVPIEGSVKDGDTITRNLGIRITPEIVANNYVVESKISADGLSLLVKVDVQPDLIFQVILGRYPGNPENRGLVYYIGSIELNEGSISGSVAVEEELDPIFGGVVTLFHADAIEVLATDGDLTDFVVSQARLDEELAYNFRFLAQGDYILLARGLSDGDAHTEGDEGKPDDRPGGRLPQIRGFLDANGDNVPDIVTVFKGGVVEGVDILILAPTPPEPLRIDTLAIDKVEIVEGQLSDSVSSGAVEAVITFNKALRVKTGDDGDIDANIDFDIVPNIFGDESPVLSVSDDGIVATVALDIPEDLTIQLAHGSIGIGSKFRQDFYFGSGALQDQCVSGQLFPDMEVDLEGDETRAVGIVVLVKASVVEDLIDEDGRVVFEEAGDGSLTAGKAGILTQIAQHVQQRQPADGPEGRGVRDEGPLQGGPQRAVGLGIGRFFDNAVRIAVPIIDLTYRLGFVDDGEYFVAASVSVNAPGRLPRQMIGFHDPEGSGQPSSVVVKGGDVEEIDIFLERRGRSSEPTPDFDGDGTVGFTDFLAFAVEFGKTSASADFNRAFDLDGDGSIGFTDFIAFAGAFGTSVKLALAKPVVTLPALNGGSRVQLALNSGSKPNELVVRAGIADADAVQGFSFLIGFDEAVLELVSAYSVNESLFASGGEPALQSYVSGGFVLADIMSKSAVTEGNLAEMRFRVLDSTAETTVEILNAMVSDPRGGIVELIGVRLEDVRAIPNDFGLNQNFPNPFNPETQVSFQVPEAGNLSLIIYNTLGQQVRVLQQGPVKAGFHRVFWDSQDAFGRDVSSGTYLVRMQSGPFKAVKKMMLVK